MIIKDERFIDVYLFLSYDSIDLFSNELWLNFLNISEIKTLLREILQPYLIAITKYYENFENISYKINSILLQKYEIKFFQLLWWIRNIFISSGEDRSNEFFWKILCSYVFHNYNKLNNFDLMIIDKLKKIGELCIKQSKFVEEKIKTNNTLIHSKFNDKIIKMRKLKIDTISTLLTLIINHNNFINLWNNEFSGFSIEDLVKVYDVGKKITENQNFKIDKNFPGSWNFEINEYYSL